MPLTTSPQNIEITGFDATSLAQHIFEITPELREEIDNQVEVFLVDNKERVRARLSEIALHPFVKMTRPFTSLRRNAKKSDADRQATIERFQQEPPQIQSEDRRFLNSLLYDFMGKDESDEDPEEVFSISLLVEHAKGLLAYYEHRIEVEEASIREYVGTITNLVNGMMSEDDIIRYANDHTILEKAGQYLKDPVFADLLTTYSHMVRLSSHYKDRYESFAAHLREYVEPIGHA